MAFTQKSSSVIQRDEGEFPPIPKEDEALKEWWSNTTAILNRVRDKVGETESVQGEQGPRGEKGEKGDTGANSVSTAEELKTILNIQGDAVGTLNDQEMENKVLGGGSF